MDQDLPDTPFEALPLDTTWEDLIRRVRALRGPIEEEDRQIFIRKGLTIEPYRTYRSNTSYPPEEQPSEEQE